MTIVLAEDEIIKVLTEHVKKMIGLTNLRFGKECDGFTSLDDCAEESQPVGLKFRISL